MVSFEAQLSFILVKSSVYSSCAFCVLRVHFLVQGRRYSPAFFQELVWAPACDSFGSCLYTG